ncbi:hypothetical protein EBS02_11865 [bacterium]|nr:hypothetical protein [bacterium]
MNSFIITISLVLIMTIPTNPNLHSLHFAINNTLDNIVTKEEIIENVFLDTLTTIVEDDQEAEDIVEEMKEEMKEARRFFKGFG